MTDKEILDKALIKAVKGGYSQGLANSYLRSPIYQLGVESIIFSHDFAKAFWGEKQKLHENYICLHCGVDIAYQPKFSSGCNHVHYPEACDVCSNKLKDWKYHLQQIVLEKEPLKYLEKFLDKN